MPLLKSITGALAACSLVVAPASAAVTTFTDQTSFDSSLDAPATVVDTSANIGLTTAQLSAAYAGITFFGAASFVRSDALILNGQGFFGPATPHVGINFETNINAVSVFTNAFDGGRIQAYSGANGTGTLLGEAAFGTPSGSNLFGGLITDEYIGSVIFTCDFNFDLKCGLNDPAFGVASSFLASAPVPLPAAGWLFLTGIAGIAASRRRHTVN